MSTADARERILQAAERLIGQHGAEVPLRDIAVAAQQRNNSAVNYHFGSRDELIAAVIERRMTTLESHRLQLIAEHEERTPTDDDSDSNAVAELVAILVRPMLTAPYAEGSTHYARFLEQVRTHPAIAKARLDHNDWPATKIITARLDKALAPLPIDIRKLRIRALATALFSLLADHERSAESHAISPGQKAEAESEIITMLTGLLTAPAAYPVGTARRTSSLNA
ncbi:TetR family transcriptional regulator [Mycobacteroides chelonae]|uniref:TetR family transcriptional regulator n=1 Tax=Mycobacteroides chelonae TaxID=1774 RepID=UPI0039EC46CF